LRGKITIEIEDQMDSVAKKLGFKNGRNKLPVFDTTKPAKWQQQ